MSLIKNCIRDLLLLAFFVTISSADEIDADGFFNVNCTDDIDCRLVNSPHQQLLLACDPNVNKCKCEITVKSDFHLERKNGECLMSKNGPCGAVYPLVVECDDGQVCVGNKCREPKDYKGEKVIPFAFQGTKCPKSYCSFGDVDLRCNYELYQCECAKLYNGDAISKYWDVRSYYGDKNCSIGKFGPCGSKNGITMDCHGDGIVCMNGTCLDPNHLKSDLGEECATSENCKEGLLCSQKSVCIDASSLLEGSACGTDGECQEGYECKEFLWWKFCKRNTAENVV